MPYAPVPEFYARSRPEKEPVYGEDGEILDRSLVRRAGPDCRETTSFYGSKGPQRANGAALGGNEAVPHKVLANTNGSSAQTFYFSARPEFFSTSEYNEDAAQG